MISRGLRRCFFTLPNGELGVIELQLPATRPSRIEDHAAEPVSDTDGEPRVQSIEEVHGEGEDINDLGDDLILTNEVHDARAPEKSGCSDGNEFTIFGSVTKFDPDVELESGDVRKSQGRGIPTTRSAREPSSRKVTNVPRRNGGAKHAEERPASIAGDSDEELSAHHVPRAEARAMQKKRQRSHERNVA